MKKTKIADCDIRRINTAKLSVTVSNHGKKNPLTMQGLPIRVVAE